MQLPEKYKEKLCFSNNNKLSLVGMQLPEKYTENFDVSSRLLARVLKEGVQFRYNNTSSTVKGWGGGGGGGCSGKCSSGKPLKFMLLHVSICSKLVRNFSNTPILAL
jgi:hypothetical protein